MNKSITNHGTMEGNFNTGDHVIQSNISENHEVDKAFAELFREINKNQIEAQRTQNEFLAQQLQQAVTNKDKTTAKKVFGFLTNSLGNVSALITIGLFLGIPVPPLP